MRRSGISLLAGGLLLAACFPYGFAGGGFPAHIDTVAVLPFENETASSTLQGEIHNQLERGVEGRLGLHPAPEGRADAVVRGTIVRYDTDIPVGYSADPNGANTARRKLQITMDVEIIDQTTGHTLWARKGLTADGEYAEGDEEAGRRIAVEKIVNDVIDGAQSQW